MQEHQRVQPGQKYALQPQALAQAVHAYAANIDNLAVLGSAVERIAEKHVSTLVKPHHYDIVGVEIIGAIKEVLGDAATPEIVEAWKEAYGFLANILIKRENELVAERKNAEGGWEDLREFVIEKKVSEASEIVSFHLKPKDNGALPNWKPGQYICVRQQIADGREAQRNYSISCPPGTGKLRITVRREFTDNIDGQVSTALHKLNEGDSIRLTVPCGEFTFTKPSDESTPIVFLALGVGITAMNPLIKEAAKTSNPITILQGARNEEWLAFKDEFEVLAKEDNVTYSTVFASPKDSSLPSQRMTFDYIWSKVPHNGHYYFLGPREWMKDVHAGLSSNGVPASNVNYEFYGPTVTF